MRQKNILLASMLAVCMISLTSCAPKAGNNSTTQKNTTYPQRTIKVINMLPANTPPDLTTKKIMSIISAKYGWKFEFESAPAAKGGEAMNKVWDAPHDGYTILAHTEVIAAPIAYGTSPHTSKDWNFFMAEQVDTALCVRSDLKINDFNEFIKYAKANPGKIKLGVSIEGYPFHLKAIAFEKVAGVKFDIKTYPGSKAQIIDIENGKIDAVLNPLQVTAPFIKNGKLRPLVMTDEQRYNFGGAIGDINSIVKIYPEYKKYLPLDAVIAFALPADVPKDITDTFAEAFHYAMENPQMLESARDTTANIINLTSTEANEYMSKIEMNFCWMAKDLGLAKVDPATLGIPRP